MPATVTVTGKIGPAETVTAFAIQATGNVNFNVDSNVLTVNGQQYSITSATTITVTKSGSTYTFTIS